MGGRGGPGRCNCAGGRAGRGQAVSSEPHANSPRAGGHARPGHGPLPTCQSQRAQVSAAGALRRTCLGVPAEGARGGPGTGGGHAGGGIGGRALVGPSRPLPALPELQTRRPELRVPPARSASSAHRSYL